MELEEQNPGSRLAPPCWPCWLCRCHAGLSHGVNGSALPHLAGSWHSRSLPKLEGQQRDWTNATRPQKAQTRWSRFEQSNPLPGCALIPLAQMEKQEKAGKEQ